MTFIYFILILGITVTIHELGHFIFAKKAGIYVYEFSIGMGPLLYKFNRKNDETLYCIRLFPIGGYVQMAGEEIELDEKIPENKRLQSKTWYQRFLTVIAGVTFNFILSLLIFFIIGLNIGYTNPKTIISSVSNDGPSYQNLMEGDILLELNGNKVNTIDRLNLELTILDTDDVTFKVLRNGNKLDVKVTPVVIDNSYYFGISLLNESEEGIIAAFKYAIYKFTSLFEQILKTLLYLITGRLSLNALSGPIGIYKVVGEVAKEGFINIIYLLGYISLNVGVVNLIPLPAFDGGRAFIMIIEGVTRKKVNQKIENTIHTIGLILLLILMLVITISDIIKIIW